MKKVPPKFASENAKKALNCIKQGSKAMTSVGRRRMNQLINREPLSKKDLMDIHKFRRHKENSKFKGDYCKDRGAVAWLGWGNSLGKEDFSNWAKEELIK